MARYGLKLVVLLFVAFASVAQAQEVIRSFHSDLSIRPDGTLEVVETIAVTVDGTEIRHGIYRDFPRYFTAPNGARGKVRFSVLAVERDGNDEPWNAEQIAAGTRVRIGAEHQMVPPGDHVYRIRYLTDRQIGFGSDHDRLVWNVTGHGWVFPILTASASVALAEGGRLEHPVAFTGPAGSTASDAEVAIVAGQASFRTTRALAPFEGFTVDVQIPKGAVAPPSDAQRSEWWWRDNTAYAIVFWGFWVVLAYMVAAWLWIGRDPKPGAIFPRWDAPVGMSPALLSYILDSKLRADGKPALSATALDLAVKGYVVLDERDHVMTIRRTEKPVPDDLPAGDIALLNMVDAYQGALPLSQAAGDDVEALLMNFRIGVDAENNGRFFSANKPLFYIGLISSIAIGFTWLFETHFGVDLAVNLLLLGAIPFVLNMVAWSMLKARRRLHFGLKRSLCGIVLVGVVFLWLFAALGVSVVLAEDHGNRAMVEAMIVSWGFVSINQLFLVLIGAVTSVGAKIKDHATGLRLYLTVAEKERMNMPWAPELTSAHFETLLPYAVALGVEAPWRRAFDTWLRTAQASATSTYAPTWYVGDDLTSSGFAGVAASMAATLDARTSEASSSSGGSGSGGGGGGGGGW